MLGDSYWVMGNTKAQAVRDFRERYQDEPEDTVQWGQWWYAGPVDMGRVRQQALMDSEEVQLLMPAKVTVDIEMPHEFEVLRLELVRFLREHSRAVKVARCNPKDMAAFVSLRPETLWLKVVNGKNVPVGTLQLEG